jgi:hypothetical protein
MSDHPQNIITTPGKTLSIRAGSVQAAGPNVARTVCTSVMDFEKVKHLLSDKPLYAPPRPESRRK